MNVTTIFSYIRNQTSIQGITLSGGEPFLQASSVYALLQLVQKTDLSVVIFTGYTLDELISKPAYQPILAMTDILIAGRYCERLKTKTPLSTSSNQKIHLLSNRYTMDDVNIPDCEIYVEQNGNITITGCHTIV